MTTATSKAAVTPKVVIGTIGSDAHVTGQS